MGREVPGRDDVFRDEFDSWETGVQRGDDEWVIVEQYESREAAEAGHKKWVELVRTTPTADLPKLMLWEM